MVETAREAGLGVTIHVGEEGGDMGREEIGEVVERLRPDRIGHGILAARSRSSWRRSATSGITLEICPTSNLLTKALPGEEAVRDTIRSFVEHDVPFTIATDGPEMMRTHLRDELELLLRIGALDEAGASRGERARSRGRVQAAGRRHRVGGPRMSDSEELLRAAESVEGLKARLEREHNELLQELRALIPGATVLFGFLLAISFTDQFADLDRLERNVYYVTLVCNAVALVLFLAPAAHHRLRFREGDKDHVLQKGNREAIAGSVASSLALTGVVYLVTEREFGNVAAIVAACSFFAFIAWRWWSFALLRSLRESRRL